MRPLSCIVQGVSQIHGWLRWCLPQGHGWSGPDPDRSPDLGAPDWLGICTTCGKVAPPRPSWRRFVLMGDCA